ncbi:MAG: 16S rRNA (cytosine(1402)-N(4))-methyltransferase RsmH [Acidimicrobiia bacterium]|nr:16S rRNA (cytosine(1402)-N(4))-methyltransferase RsmH [Acidimicrobiia bacterium]MDH3397495.1 16S rRNA (cytosine(1402)-N(4))-methyltransferase RsmH [Acidimicrobiia bacterium]
MNQTPESRKFHEAVMAEEVVELFRPLHEGLIIDATYGGGGHSRRILDALGSNVRILAFDRDPDAIREAEARRADADPGNRLQILNRNYRDMEDVMIEKSIESFSGAFFDLGVSSHQVEEGTRGFSYRAAGPLDMRMGPDAPHTAAELVNEWSEADLARVIRSYGEEPFAARVARAIVAARPIDNTVQLAEIIRLAIPAAARRTGGHPARRTFQGLRIAANDELGALEQGLEAALSRLRPAGRCVVISYHSLEDRIVKQRFAAGATGCTCPPDFPICVCEGTADLRLLTRKPLRPTPAEVAINRRARSARLRAVEKVAA